MPYTFDPIFAVDPGNPANVAADAELVIFAPGDTLMSPLTLTTPDGLPFANPVTTNGSGFAGAFVHETLGRVAWAGGGFTGFFTAYDSLKEEAVAAKDAAAASASEAAASADSSAASAALVDAPADVAVKTLLGDPATQTRIEADKLFVGKGSLVINVKDYGAIGDGVADDTLAVQAAIDAAAGRTLVPSAGTYIVSQLSFTASLDIAGGQGAVFKQKSASNKHMLQITGTNVTLRVSGITIDQNNAGQTAGSGKFLFNMTTAGSTAEFRNVTFRDFCEGALRIVGDRESSTREALRVYGCRFRGGTESVSSSYDTFTIFGADAAELTVCDSDFDHRLTLTAQGIPAITVGATITTSAAYSEVTVRNNRFQGYGRYTQGSGVGVIDAYAWVTRMEVTGNKFTGSRVTPIRGKVNILNAVISGNIMTDFVNSGAGFGHGISLVSSTLDPIGGNYEISSNVIKGAAENGINLSHSSGTIQNANVHDNVIDSAALVGISLVRFENFNIHDNIIKASGSQAVTLSTCAGKGRVVGNTVAGSALAGIQTIGSQLTLDLHMMNNFVEASTSSGITVEDVRSLALQGNTVKDVIDGGASGQRAYRIGGTNGITLGQSKNNTAIGTYASGIYTVTGAGILTAFEDGNSWNFQKGYANAAPTAGTYVRGSVVWNTTPIAGGTVGWICTTAGSPGTWKAFGTIAA